MDHETYRKINDKTNIVDLVSEFVQLEKRGKNYFGLCPFHDEKTPSFSVSPEKNICKCMSCGEGGQPITFYSKIKGLSIQDAAIDLAERAGIKINDRRVKKDPHANHYAMMKEAMNFYSYNLTNSKSGQAALTYLHDRGLTDETIKHFHIGFSPSRGDTLYQILKNKQFSVSDMIKLGLVKQSDDGTYYDLFANRVMFPVTDFRGHVVGFSGRTLSKKENIKYINSPETEIFKKSELIYHLYEGLSDIRKTKRAVLHEGFFDVIASYQAGIKNGIATMGTSLTNQHAKLLKQVTSQVVLAYDGDKAGQKATHSAINTLQSVAINMGVLVIPEGMDPDDFVQNYGATRYESLYVDHIVDPYQFRYQSYKKNLNLNNANDIKTFKDLVVKMLIPADQTIQAIYRKKLATDLHINPEDIVIKASRKVVRGEPYRTPLPKKPVKKPILNRFENAERYLLCGMLRSKKYCEYIKTHVEFNDHIEPKVAMLRIKVEAYYQENDILVMDDFLNRLTTEERTFMENDILKNVYWVNIFDFDNEGFDEYIHILKGYAERQHLIELKKQLKEKPNDLSLLSEYQMLQAKLKQ